ncbi:eukaryotic translation initiation factor 5B-like isoform X2 [Coffea eugenioides]|uniref:eukaryotic translation initiation factor 5B-like isoform X2 n=1 Tax=Coffea eugenioides TaxID=49369 RepID=UPI000F61586E|nr:eukaryotic translation initiation factor 5B-like isoform X2 [Coffea eugenioides]
MGRKKPSARDDEVAGATQGGVGGGKPKKKNLVIDDDEYSVGTELSEESNVQEEKTATVGGGKKKGKKGNAKKGGLKEDDDDDDHPEERIDDKEHDEALDIQFAGKKKGKAKKGGNNKSNSVFSSGNFGLLGDEDGETEVSELTQSRDGESGGSEDDGENVVAFTGKKKPTKSKKGGGKSVFSAAPFDAIGVEDDEAVGGSVSGELSDKDDETVIAFSGKKKPSKSGKKGGSGAFTTSPFGAIGDGDDGGVDDLVSGQQSDNGEPLIEFSGKKKPSKTGKKGGGSLFSTSSFNGLEDGENKEESKEEDEDIASITFTGKKKKSSKSSKKSSANSFDAAVLDEETIEEVSMSKSGAEAAGDGASALDELDTSVAMFSGKKKSSKKKGSGAITALDAGTGDESLVVAEADQPSVSDSSKQIAEDVAETLKNKKKKKKSGRTAQEEEDLDKILAELGEAPPVSKPSPTPTPGLLEPTAEEKVQSQLEQDGAGEKEAEEGGPAESAAAKKKKKKKEKEKEKKAAAAAPVTEDKQEDSKNETKGKASDKKVPKHVREMQERLARLKEAEERKKREEEEKLRKEEEERRRQEELERLAEEKKRLKKEREKEKLMKKKQEGKLLTGKQKEEARRLEAMRKQILANAGGLPLPTGDAVGVPTKRPKYQTKKSKPASQANGAAVAEAPESQEIKESEIGSEVDSVETEKYEEVQVLEVEKPQEVEVEEENEVEVEEEDDDEEWDAKSWDDADLKLPGKSAFADEEVDSEPENVGKKELKSTRPATNDAGSRPLASKTATAPLKSVNPEVGAVEKQKQREAPTKMDAAEPVALPTRGENNLRSPICCIMGHVDTGKTKLLDCIRGTNVQEGEAGGITQQIGATYFPAGNIRERTKELKADAKLSVPGLLVIDTPGHESFTNLRSRGSGLCDIAILVVDIMHGLEPQTIESLNLLKMRNTEFIVALNKVDRLYGWKTCRNAPIMKAMKQQSKDIQAEFNMRLTQVITQFKEQGINTELYYKNKEMGETFSIVPTSAISGEGIPDLLLLLVQWTQKTMVEKLTFQDEVQCTVLEVKVVEGHGTTIDVVLVNGVLHEGDQIVVCGMQGPIVTSIRALLTPHPMKELRVKGTYVHHKEIKAAQGIKITAQGLEHAIAGTGLYVVGPDDDVEDIKEAAMEDMRTVMNRIDKSGEGVYVQASTLGSLEALLEFLKTPVVNIPVSGIGIGPVHKKDVMKASVMLEKKKEYATILAFDVRVTPEARELADELGVKIFCADIIYHLFDQFKAYIDNLKEEKKKEAADDAVFPCVLKIIPNCVFNKKDPIVLGVDVLEGVAKIGTPICIPQKDFIDIGRIASIENNHKPVDYAKKGQKVAIKIVGSNPEEQQKMFGRHFEIEDELVSHISRRSIDILKANYREDLSLEEWKLVAKLKNLFKIP